MKKYEKRILRETTTNVELSTFNVGENHVKEHLVEIQGVLLRRFLISGCFKDNTGFIHFIKKWVLIPSEVRLSKTPLKELKMTTLFSLKPLRDSYPIVHKDDNGYYPVFRNSLKGILEYDDDIPYPNIYEIPHKEGMIYRIPIIYGDEKNPFSMKGDPTKFIWWEDYQKSLEQESISLF